MTAFQFIKYSGMSGAVCLFLALTLGVVGMLMFALSKRREPFALIVGGAAAIFLLGLFGFGWGLLGMLNTIAVSPTAPSGAEVAGGVTQSLCSLVLAIPLTLMIGFIGVVGLAVKPSDAALLAAGLDEASRED